MKSPQKVAIARLRQHTKFSVFYVTLCPFFTSLCEDVDDNLLQLLQQVSHLMWSWSALQFISASTAILFFDTQVEARISIRPADISSWMSGHQLKLSLNNAVLLFLYSGKSCPLQGLFITAYKTTFAPEGTAKNLRLPQDDQLWGSSPRAGLVLNSFIQSNFF